MRDPATAGGVRSAVLLGTVAAGLMLGQTVFAKATRDALFLANFPVAALPKLVVAAAALSVVAMLVTSRALTVLSPARFVPAAFAASGVLYLAEWAISLRSISVTTVAVYLHLAVLSAVVSSAFWSLVNERFDPHTARRVFGRIAAGGTVGAVVGGVAAWQFGSKLPLAAMLVVLAALNFVCAVAVRRLATPSRREPVRPDGPTASATPSGLQVIREVPYLRQLGLLVGLVALVQSQADYVLKDAASSLAERGQLVTFFALFHAGAGLASFLVQSTLSRRSLDKLGLAGTAALLPALVVLAGVTRLVVPAMWTAVLLAGVDAVLSTSLYRAGYELMYTPVAKEKKRPTKTIIDVGIDRLGTSLGAGATLLILAVVPHDPTTYVVAVAIVGSLVALWVAVRLHGGYVGALAESLLSGAIRLEDHEVLDASTRRTLAETTALSRSAILREIGRRQQSTGAAAGADARAAATHEPQIDPLLADLADLRSSDADAIARVLERPGAPAPELVAAIVPLLGSERTRKEAAEALLRALPRATGQLLDALLDPSTPVVLRRRLPRVLGAAASPRAIDGMMSALQDPVFAVRWQTAMALLDATGANPSLTPPREAVLAAAQRELSATVAGAPVLDAGDDLASSLVDEELRARVDRRLECIFAILSLALDREPLRIAFHALASSDRSLRGTALEYLDNVLPDSLRDGLRPLLGERRPTGAPTRPRQQIVAELLLSASTPRPAKTPS